MDFNIGNDIERVERIDFLVKKRFSLLKRIFYETEIEYAFNQRSPSESLTGIWCAKEAVLKAICEKITIRDIEIKRKENGVPIVIVHNLLANNIQSVKVSISHTKDYAIASAIVIYNQ
jgi:holo-[acyl-carrier protein] synthase